MNSRRLNCPNCIRPPPGSAAELHDIELERISQEYRNDFATCHPSARAANVAVGSFASFPRCPSYVRSSSGSGGIADIGGSLKGARKRHIQCSKKTLLFD